MSTTMLVVINAARLHIGCNKTRAPRYKSSNEAWIPLHKGGNVWGLMHYDLSNVDVRST